MFIISTISQLEDALRCEAHEVLVIGRVASQIYNAIEGKVSIQAWGSLYKNMILVLRTQYDVLDYRGNENNACLLIGRHYKPSNSPERIVHDSSTTNQ